jgi:DNA mismatch repair ATPase MutS
MAFVTDQQTLEDLTIFGRRGGESIYGLFNRTMTRQGSAVLEDMLRHPLSDGAAIGTRISIFQSFAALGTSFPFRSELFDVAEAYLSVTDERTRLSGDAQTLGSRMASMIAEDNDYKNIYKGVMALMEILQQLQTFVAGVTPDAYGEEKAVILSLLAEGELQPLLQEDPGSKLPYSRVAVYDTVLRFRHRGTARRLLQYVYRLDAYLAVGRVAAERGFVFPVVVSSSRQRVFLEGVYHPQVKNAVANTVEITAGQPVIFLTGANMAGKSTFMKSLGISLFLAHAGFPVAARRMEFSVLDGIYTTINLPDNLGMGASHFYAEVLRVKKVATALGQGRRLLVIFDELFRGTNVKDAYEATVALTSAFAQRRDSFFVISTHIIEAGEVLTATDAGIRPLYLPTRMSGNQPVYTYQLEDGITADRHGMIIINNEGILEMLRAGVGRESAGRSGGDRAAAANGGGGFEADQQTLADLNLTGKYRPGSIFSLFNQVKTVGGERLLEEMFSRPLGDAEEINRRSGRWRYLQEKRLSFPFNRQQLSRVEDYLHAGAGGRWATMTHLFRLRLLAVVLKDEQYAAVAEGVRGVMDFIRDCRAFFQQFDGRGRSRERPISEAGAMREGETGMAEGPWATEVGEAREILGDARLGEWKEGAMALAYYHHVFGQVLNQRLQRLCAILYELDLGIAVGDVGRQKGFTWARARRAEDNVFHAADLRHPGLDKAVGNGMAFSGDSNVLFLTGANMAGKSTLMKSFGIAVYLAHMGFPVAARDMEFSVREGLYSSINVPDDLSLGYSHFYAEVLRVKKVAEAVSAGRNLVVIFDELFKGTNVKDAYDATLSVTEALAAYSRCWFVISTHIIEVGETLRQKSDNLQFAYLPTIMEGVTPRYPYILEKGITNDRHGMLIIGNEGILDILSVKTQTE